MSSCVASTDSMVAVGLSDKLGRGRFHIMLLVNVFQEGDGKYRPPDTGQQDGGFHGGNTEIGEQQQDDGDDEGDGAAAQISHGVAPGGNPVHTLVGGNVRQKGIIEYIGPGKTDVGDHVSHQHELPASGEGRHRRKAHAQRQKKDEQLLFHAPEVAESAQKGRHYRDDQGSGGNADAPPFVARVPRDAGVVNRKYRRHHVGGVHGVGPVVQNPAFFRFCKFVVSRSTHHDTSLRYIVSFRRRIVNEAAVKLWLVFCMKFPLFFRRFTHILKEPQLKEGGFLADIPPSLRPSAKKWGWL